MSIEQLITERLDIWTAADTEKKSGRGRGSANSGNVYGIKKLRELIYELAATGKLIKHNGDSNQCLLGEVAEFIMGQAPPGNECNKSGDGIVFVKTGEFGLFFPDIKEWTTKPLKFAKEGDILICVVGATIGKLNYAINCAIGRSVAAIRPDKTIDTKYLYIVITPFTLKLREKSRGSAQGVIGKTELATVEIRVPSIKEQHRIVAKVDELMALCDQLENQHNNAAEAHEKLVAYLLGTLTQSQNVEDFNANWQRIVEHFDTLFTTETSIDELKQTLLQLAVMGKLVPQDPHDEPASELLKRIQAEKANLIAEGKIKKDKPLAPITEEEKPFDLPIGWEWVRLGQLISLVSGKGFSASEYINEGIRLFQIANVSLGFTKWEIENFLPVEYLDLYPDLVLVDGDVLVALNRPLLNGKMKVCIISEEDLPAILYQRVGKFKFFGDYINTRYFYLFLQSRLFIDHLQTQLQGSDQPFINQSQLVQFCFSLPPIKEQDLIVVKVDELMAICDQLKTRINEANELQRKIADVVVGQATS